MGEHPRGDRRRRYGMWNSQRVDPEGDKIWSVKKKKKKK
ncbi:rCG22984 [Rattus norvegicus]|uniref:RCG22984 n=1 Tax=Rattus norvegicus TaxID=10116 RepID=A6KB53_RAT|nr:rCG22984 [Rattus norvegicus]